MVNFDPSLMAHSVELWKKKTILLILSSAELGRLLLLSPTKYTRRAIKYSGFMFSEQNRTTRANVIRNGWNNLI